jgi:hypothetical protein
MRYGGTDAWPEWEVLPTSDWNYALELDGGPEHSFEIDKKTGRLPQNPFTLETVPISLRAKARKIPAWKLDSLGLVGKLQDSPVKSDSPQETVTLIPMGVARLRIACFPVVGRGADAREWQP